MQEIDSQKIDLLQDQLSNLADGCFEEYVIHRHVLCVPYCYQRKVCAASWWHQS